ncbi:unnamed protein product [Caenorhabditis bovis]|uniref:Mcm6 C-terminal winged-helix domain-containing protein n=1 Tax=Caenorhabditis bovis TaxID=2654633 RepID=A0A8S1EZS4_9PELO|nr:unnamed protein product [Caenorhabditis bovis]
MNSDTHRNNSVQRSLVAASTIGCSPVEKADVDLEDDDFDKDIVVVEPNKENEEEGMEHDGEDAENLKPKIYPAKLKLKYEDYKKMSDEDYGGVKQIEEDLGSEEDYLVQKTVCERVICRLIHDERVLLEVEQGDDPTLCVHPNYAMTDE